MKLIKILPHRHIRNIEKHIDKKYKNLRETYVTMLLCGSNMIIKNC